jgi:hypothetical protein
MHASCCCCSRVEGTWNVKATTIERSARGRDDVAEEDRTGQGHIDGDPSHSHSLVPSIGSWWKWRGSMKLARAIVLV